jgi:hypothetical protein
VPEINLAWNLIDSTRSRGPIREDKKEGVPTSPLYLTRKKYNCVPRSSVPEDDSDGHGVCSRCGVLDGTYDSVDPERCNCSE